jgi:secondary thiamine-phosphate synthase enzyme
MLFQETITVQTAPKSTSDVTQMVEVAVAKSGCDRGLVHVFCRHTSASLMLCENADPDVRRDLEAFMERLVPESDSAYRHDAEGADDMPAHIRTLLSHSDLTMPVRDGRCDLGTWQGIYLWEHRDRGHARQLTITVSGE